MKPALSRLLLVALCLAPVGFTGCQAGSQRVLKAPIPVTVGMVSDRNQAISLRYSGTIEPGIVVPVAFRTGGYVKEIAGLAEGQGVSRFLQSGDPVASGAFLAKVEDREYQSRSMQARAGVREAQSGLLAVQAQAAAAGNSARQARDEYLRAKRLFETDSVTRVEFDTARTRSQNADEALFAAQGSVRAVQAKVQAAQAIAQEIESVASDTSVRAPIDGVLLSRNIESGSLVGPGMVGFIVAQIDPLKIRFAIPDRFLGKVTPGTTLDASLDFRPDWKIRGKVTRIALSADPKTRLFDVEVTVPNPDAVLKPGMIVQVELNPRRGEGRGLIPLEAIVPGLSGEKTFAVFQVSVLDGRTIARRREVKLGRPFGNLIAAEAGILPGEKIVISGAAFLEDGDPVHVVEESQ